MPVGSDSDLVACVHDGRLVVAGTVEGEVMAPLASTPVFYYEWDDRAETWKEQPLLHDGVSAWPYGRLASLVSVPLRIG